MKTKLIALAVLAAAVALTGCWQKSVHSFYTEKDVFFEEKLLGEWREVGKEKEEGEGTTWTISKGELPKAYTIKIADKETKLECDGRLFKMADTQFLDLYSRNRSVLDMPAHTLFRVRELGATFKLQLLSPGWMKDRLQLHPKEISHVLANDPEHPDDGDKGEFILTASTEQLQKYVKEHINDEGFWEEPGELKKTK
ncbi:MAG TPA: hypothetical protein VM680_19150 [Verrucomicrobiae bacterium]|nr:hypothetical protein [Verrucomicrobiae bacterium]